MTLYKNAVFQGQGIRSFAFIGGLQGLEEKGIKFQSVSGVSGGSIVAALYAAGYTSEEMKKIFYDVNIIKEFNLANDYQKFINNRKKINIRQIISYINYFFNPDNPMSLIRIFLGKGFAESDNIGSWISNLLEKKGVKTFTDLYDLCKIELTIIAADITENKLLILNKDTYPQLPIADAVECSICIPGFFRFKKIVNREITDGGILSTLPLFVFEDELDNTVAFEISEDAERLKDFFAADLVNSYVNIVYTAWKAHDTFLKDREKFNNSLTVSVSKEIHSIKFELDNFEKKHLINQGYIAANNFLTKKNFEKYLELQKLLQKQEWIDANIETGKILLYECGKNNNQWFEEGDIARILENKNSRRVFDDLEKMWMNSSNNKFGFINQKNHWRDSGKPKMEAVDIVGWNKFIDKVGWKSNNILVSVKTLEDYKNEIKKSKFNLKEIQSGYLPNLYLLWFKNSPAQNFLSMLDAMKTFLEKGNLPLIELFEGLDS